MLKFLECITWLYYEMEFQLKKILLFFIFCFFITEQSAQAYIDPASGSMVMQVLIAFVGAVGYGLSLFWGKIKRFWCKGNDKE